MITRDEIRQKLYPLIAKEFSLDSKTLMENFKITEITKDSLEYVEMIMKIEEEFGVQFTDQKAEEIIYLAQIIDFIEESLNKSP